MISKIIFVFIYLNCVFGNEFYANNESVVETTSGKVRGLTFSEQNRTIEQFLGIPFAEPPVGSLRFAKPKPISKAIEGVIDATKVKNSCTQPMSSTILSALSVGEDCLTLNIWSQKKEDNNSTKLKPVMFWIYGGGLQSGSIFLPIYNGSVLAAQDVVVVSVNYRVGYLGFLYGGEESAPGNVGFYDQLLGLKWVRENIHSFGGDKNQITIFGESAGSWSVSAHVISPLSKGLFKRAIMESGAHMYKKDRPVISKSEALIKAKLLANRVNCTDDKKWLECLRKVDAKLLIPSNDLIFPVDGTEFLPLSAQKAFSTNKYNNDIDLIAGIVRDEGSTLSQAFLKNLKGNFSKSQFDGLVAFIDSIFHGVDNEKVIKFYLENVDTKNSTALRKAFYEYFGDLVIKCPTYHFAKQFAKNTPNRKTFFYELTYEGLLAKLLGCDEKTMGICHGADVEFVFGISLKYPTLPKLEVEFSREVMKMWTNFAKNGDPGAKWPQMVDGNSSRVKNLNPNNLSGVLIDPFKSSCDGLWQGYF